MDRVSNLCFRCEHCASDERDEVCDAIYDQLLCELIKRGLDNADIDRPSVIQITVRVEGWIVCDPVAEEIADRLAYHYADYCGDPALVTWLSDDLGAYFDVWHGSKPGRVAIQAYLPPPFSCLKRSSIRAEE